MNSRNRRQQHTTTTTPTTPHTYMYPDPNSQQPPLHQGDRDPNYLQQNTSQGEETVFYFEGDNDGDSGRGDNVQDGTNTPHNSSNNNSGNDNERRIRETDTVQCEPTSHTPYSDDVGGCADGEDMTNSASARNHNENASSSRTETPTKPIPLVQRANSSPLKTVYRGSDCQVVVRCQVDSFYALHMSSSCPATFSPQWTQVVKPVTRTYRKRAAASSSERRRRHTVGPTANALLQAQSHHFQQLYNQHHPHDTEPGSSPDAMHLQLWQARGRSLSDSELQHLLMVAVAKELKRVSDEFNCIYTGKQLTPVRELATSESDVSSDDEMN